MKNLFLSIILVLTTTLTVSGQNYYIYKDDNQYEATSSWEFELNGRYWTGNPLFRVAKHTNGGYLMISLEVPFMDYIGGTVTIFLSNGSIIKCVDRGIRDHVDNRSIALYNFTMTEIKLLKQNRITRIRFSIMDGFGKSQTFTADNRKPMSYLLQSSFFNSIGVEKRNDEKEYYETDIYIHDLYNK